MPADPSIPHFNLRSAYGLKINPTIFKNFSVIIFTCEPLSINPIYFHSCNIPRPDDLGHCIRVMILGPLRDHHSLFLLWASTFSPFPVPYPSLVPLQIRWNLYPLFFLLYPLYPLETYGSLLWQGPLHLSWSRSIHHLHPGHKWRSIWVLALLALVLGGGLIYPPYGV